MQLCPCCCIMLLRFYGLAVMLCLALVGYRQRTLYCEGVTLQIARTTCSTCCGCLQPVVHCCCCIRSTARQLLFWLGNEYLHVTVKGLATVGSPKPIVPGILHMCITVIHVYNEG